MIREPSGPIIIVTDLPYPRTLTGIPHRTADEYLEGKGNTLAEDRVVINLCRSYQYLSKGYYVSLIADARHQRVFPALEMVEDIT